MTRQIVVPGEKVEGNVEGYVYRDGKDAFSAIFGFFEKKDNEGRIIPLKGKYMPIEGDYIVGIVTDVKFGGVTVDLNSPYNAFLPTQREYDWGDVISAKVMSINEVKSATLEDENKLAGGELVEMSPVRVPRVIGKKSSMVTMIQDKTKSEIFVGRNGRIWIRGGDSAKAIKTILKIEREAHTEGLTDRIKEFLEK